MEVNWSTFILEIINFLILVWILKRFLYKPVMDSIAKRRASIEQSLQEATQRDQEAQALKTQYENRLEDWEHEKQAAREQLHNEIDQERQHLEQQLQAALEQEKEKAKVLAAQQEQEQQRHYEQQALHNAVRFTSKLLGELASPELETRLLTQLLSRLQALPKEQRERLGKALNEHELTAQVQTAFPLTETQQARLQETLQTIVGRELNCQFTQEDALLAGVRIHLGPWLLQANLQDELEAFAQFEHHTAVPRP